MTAPTDPAVITLLRDLAAVGARVSPSGPNLRYSAPAPLAPELRARLVALKAPVLVYLTIWSAKRATALMREADELVSQLGVNGHDPEIQAGAARFVAAQSQKDMAGCRCAAHAIEDRARFLAASVAPVARSAPEQG